MGVLRGVGQAVAKGGGTVVAKEVTQLSKEAQKGIRSLEKQIAAHENKLAEFKMNPTIRPGMGKSSEGTD
jgi:hypothetical protein